MHSDDEGRFVASLEPLRQLTTAARSQLYVSAATVAAEHASHGSYPMELANLLRRSGDEPAFTLLLQQEPLVTGWVVDSNGREVPEALLCYRVGDDHGEDTCSDDGRYTVAVGYDFEAGQDLALYAAHRRFGISDVHHVRVDADGHTPVPDLVLRPAPTRIEGTVRWPDGSGAAGVEVRFERMDDEADTDAASRPTRDLRTIAGRVAHADERKHPSVDTDDDGRFNIAFLRPGRYVFEFGTGEPFEFDVPADVVTRIDHRMRAAEQTQLRVDVVDEQGLSLSDSWLGLHHWRGAHAAATAAARFAAEGPSADLLATADHFDKMFYLDEPLFDVRPDSFVIAEAACHDRGPAYAATLVAPGQGRADITVLLGPRTATGAVQLEVGDPSGAELGGPHLVRVCRGHAGHALPVLLPDCDTRSGPTSGIAGFWHVVPDDGVLRDLPAGGLTLQVLANVSVDGERCTRAPWPLEQRFVELAADDDLRVDVTTRPGSHIDLHVIAHDTAKHGIEVDATLRPAGGAARRERFVTTDRGERSGAFVDGRVHLRSISALAPGQYRLEVRTNAKLYDAAIPDRNVHWQRTVTLPLAAPVQVQLSQR